MLPKINSTENIGPFRAECATLGLPSDDPRIADTQSRRKDLRNACKAVVNAVGARTFEARREPTDAEMAVLDEATGRIQFLDRALAANDRATAGDADGGTFSPPPGMSQEAWQAQIGASSSRRPTAGKYVDTATGRPIPAINKFDDLGSINSKLGVRGDDAQFGMADWLRGVAGMGGPTREITTAVKNTLSEGVGSAGGYLTPNVLTGEVLAALTPASTLLNAGVPILMLPMGGAAFNVAAIATVPTASFRAENAAVAVSDPTLTQIVLTPRSLAFQFSLSRELLMDAVNLDAIVIGVIAQSMAVAIDAAGLRGTGIAPNPTGILNNATVNAVANGTNGATLSSLKFGNLSSAFTAILAANAFMPTDCIMAPRSLMGFSAMVDTTGQPLRRPDPLAAMNLAATSAIPIGLTVGSSVDCTELYVGAFSKAMLFGCREVLTILRANELNAGNGQVTFFANTRIDVGIFYPQALAKITGVRAA